MTLHELVETYGADAIARETGVSKRYIEQCLLPNSKHTVRRVKLVNAAKKLVDNNTRRG